MFGNNQFTGSSTFRKNHKHLEKVLDKIQLSYVLSEDDIEFLQNDNVVNTTAKGSKGGLNGILRAYQENPARPGDLKDIINKAIRASYSLAMNSSEFEQDDELEEQQSIASGAD
ncbi:hypothetical protein [Wolbachia endosymbiont of Ctenocephalides felis wCfeT]|uniref:hypothetical protein n=1 Tax=Wolbachia endosymbiont of Ctenocephalides felis wCfeT TaxID=2732593 RepID=UPI001447D2A8|nr:hypothetical protein [Wolbachia endosymbiont of Ctenocephalides felis wCfeT]